MGVFFVRHMAFFLSDCCGHSPAFVVASLTALQFLWFM
jgi:hypothetical protein